MKLTRTQKNETWSKTLEIEIVTVSGKKFGDPGRYAFAGSVDAKALAPTGTFAALKTAINAAKKMDWKEI